MPRSPSFHNLAMICALAASAVNCVAAAATAAEREQNESPQLPAVARDFLKANCLDCHDAATREAGLDLENLSVRVDDRAAFQSWVHVHDRVRDGEMPPAEFGTLDSGERARFLRSIASSLAVADRERARSFGRAAVRRLNRHEYQNSVRTALAAPWLHVAEMLPEDSTAHLFNKVGERLDVSHVQISRYLESAEHAVREAFTAVAHPPRIKRYYAREDPQMVRNMTYRSGQMSPTRATIPLIGTTPQPDVVRGDKPVTVGESDPVLRELEAFGVVSGTYAATLKYDFTEAYVPASGRYRIRLKSYTFLAGPNGRRGGDDDGLTGGDVAWWRPSRTEAFRGTRSEPITIYSLTLGGDSRRLGGYDAVPDPTIAELDVVLQAGETIRPDAGRLVRTRPGWRGNPNATEKGVPGFALNWLEVEGPLHDQWPPRSYRVLFGDLPYEISDDEVKVRSEHPSRDASWLLARFMRRAYRRPLLPGEVEPFVGVYENATALGEDFTNAMVAGFVSILCSPGFLYLESEPGPLDDHALASRLSYFLWNSPPARRLRQAARAGSLSQPEELAAQAERLLDDRQSDLFVNAFLDYWLDLRDINANAPDADLYPDYYLDDQLTESSLLETRRFFRELIDKNLPARNVIDADFAFLNERLAEHYGLPAFEGIGLRRVELPEDSPYGGLLTQASVMRVTANGTTTSPVIRGAWVMERLLGRPIPPPPSGVPAIDPDIRGATTIREQLELHRAVESCAQCHAKFDPIGLALENFDVAGGWRDRYRAMGDVGERPVGYGKNGHEFQFRRAQRVDSAGVLADGRAFEDARTLKQCLLGDERQLARNLVQHLVVYATGAPVSFSDREEIERILDEAEVDQFGVRTLILGIVASEMFRIQ